MAPFSSSESLNEGGKTKRFRLNNGKIVYQMQQAQDSSRNQSHYRGGCKDWYGCSICNHWFPDMSQLEDHYDREHEWEETYKFELLELKNCVIQLPYVKKPLPIVNPGNNVSTLCESNRQADGLNQSSSKTLPNSGKGSQLSMKQAIRLAIKVTQDNGQGSSYKKIKSYLLRKVGMDAEKVGKKLRRLLEYYVEYKKLERQYRNGKTLYSMSTCKRERGTECRIPKEETRHWRDQKLKKIAKSLKPHGITLLPH